MARGDAERACCERGWGCTGRFLCLRRALPKAVTWHAEAQRARDSVRAWKGPLSTLFGGAESTLCGAAPRPGQAQQVSAGREVTSGATFAQEHWGIRRRAGDETARNSASSHGLKQLRHERGHAEPGYARCMPGWAACAEAGCQRPLTKEGLTKTHA